MPKAERFKIHRQANALYSKNLSKREIVRRERASIDFLFTTTQSPNQDVAVDRCGRPKNKLWRHSHRLASCLFAEPSYDLETSRLERAAG